MDVRKSGPFSYTKIRKKDHSYTVYFKKGGYHIPVGFKKGGVNLARISILCHI